VCKTCCCRLSRSKQRHAWKESSWKVGSRFVKFSNKVSLWLGGDIQENSAPKLTKTNLKLWADISPQKKSIYWVYVPGVDPNQKPKSIQNLILCLLISIPKCIELNSELVLVLDLVWVHTRDPDPICTFFGVWLWEIRKKWRRDFFAIVYFDVSKIVVFIVKKYLSKGITIFEIIFKFKVESFFFFFYFFLNLSIN
jgi:hypothetical protein